MSIKAFHTSFKLQGKSFQSVEELIDFSKTISSEVAVFLEVWFNEESFVIVKTSGSTGKPKEIQLQKKHMINSAKATGSYFNLLKDTTALLCMSPNYIAGKMMLVRALTLGWHIDVISPLSNPLENVNKEYDFSAMVPLQLNNSLNEIEKIKKLIVGGGVISNELLHKIQTVNSKIFATYGMTETITHIAVKKLNHCHSELVEESHYTVLPNIQIATDDRGCLIIEAPKVASEIIITNDLVEQITLTEFKWLGRFDTIINSGGIKLIPEQIEAKLSKIITNRFFVTGISDVILGEKLILIVENSVTEVSSNVVAERSRSVDTENCRIDSSRKEISTPLNLLSSIEQLDSLSKYEKPKEIFFIKKFIETSTNKINRKETLKSL